MPNHFVCSFAGKTLAIVWILNIWNTPAYNLFKILLFVLLYYYSISGRNSYSVKITQTFWKQNLPVNFCLYCLYFMNVCTFRQDRHTRLLYGKSTKNKEKSSHFTFTQKIVPKIKHKKPFNRKLFFKFMLKNKIICRMVKLYQTVRFLI